MITPRGAGSNSLQWQRVPWHIARSPQRVWKHKQTTLEQYSGYGKPGECGNPLVIDSSGDEEDVASKPIPSDLGDSSGSDDDIGVAQLVPNPVDEDSRTPPVGDQPNQNPINGISSPKTKSTKCTIGERSENDGNIQEGNRPPTKFQKGCAQCVFSQLDQTCLNPHLQDIDPATTNILKSSTRKILHGKREVVEKTPEEFVTPKLPGINDNNLLPPSRGCVVKRKALTISLFL
ncbi:hypothetical protein PCASD_12935 [Puccinia coronata f. sp. avenae]|uniref:Uncharacterized protein n=1 Tax=Puccinia coronata f. sp. avenae TaxID=200324 RepID=A0A2N5U9Z6_9BASI|nr:hypothetical protein PCASD_12935 [Puccinia coronata f. sp. avenae]